jgi:EmrB/QacA subfamily drug resistance transporter
MKWWTLAAVCVATFMLLLDVTIVNVALPEIERDLGATLSDLQWVINAYAVALAAVLLTAGSLADRFGRRRLFALGLTVFSLASLACGLSGDPAMLIVSRAAQGLGGAAMLATALALLADAFRGSDRAVALGLWGATTGASVAIGPLVGGVIIEIASWHWIFLVNVPVGAFALALTFARVRESRDPNAGPVDVPGLVLFAIALGGLTLGLHEAGERGWGDPLVVVVLVTAAVALVLFVAAERRRARPMLDLALFRKPTTSGASLAVLALGGGVFALLLFLVLYLQNVLGYDALGTGLRLLPFTIASFLAAGIGARLGQRVPLRTVIAAGLGIAGVGLLLMRGVHPGGEWTDLLGGFIVGGVGVGMLNPTITAAALGVVGAARAGMASGLNSTFRLAGVSIGVAALGTLFKDVAGSEVRSLVPGPAGERLAEALSSGEGPRALASVPPDRREAMARVAEQGFLAGLDAVMLGGALACLAGAVIALALVRRRDLVPAHEGLAPLPGAAPAPEASPPA